MRYDKYNLKTAGRRHEREKMGFDTDSHLGYPWRTAGTDVGHGFFSITAEH